MNWKEYVLERNVTGDIQGFAEYFFIEETPFSLPFLTAAQGAIASIIDAGSMNDGMKQYFTFVLGQTIVNTVKHAKWYFEGNDMEAAVQIEDQKRDLNSIMDRILGGETTLASAYLEIVNRMHATAV